MAGTCDEMKSVAEHAALLLGPELGSDVHFTVSYVESEEKQVTATTSSQHFPTGRVVSNIWWPQNYSNAHGACIDETDVLLNDAETPQPTLHLENGKIRE